MEIFYDEKICVHCAACVSESENGGIKFENGKIIIDETKIEDWHTIAVICPVAALTVKNVTSRVQLFVLSEDLPKKFL